MLLNKKENVFHTGCRLSAEERQMFPFRMEKFFFPSMHSASGEFCGRRSACGLRGGETLDGFPEALVQPPPLAFRAARGHDKLSL